ncbi:MAG: DegV family protein [Clostridia bacterium]|nr:DegV family protein [Clostridia bacterium]
MSFLVTTDSGCDLPFELLKERGITPLMMSYTMNGADCKDTMNANDCHMFYEGMRSGMLPRTSQLNPSEFIDFWSPLLSAGLPILHISLGSRVSGTWQNGCTAAKMLMEKNPDLRISCVDSTLCSTGYGMLALEAARMRDEGKSFDEAVSWVEDNKIRVNTWYTTDELLYLRRSGRCSRASAIIGTALKICPILNLDAEGHLIVQERVRGLNKTVHRLHQIIGDTVENADDQILYVCHSDIPEQAKEFGESLQKTFGFKEVRYPYIGAIIGSNCGPGLMAAFYFGKPRTMDGYKGK